MFLGFVLGLAVYSGSELVGDEIISQLRAPIELILFLPTRAVLLWAGLHYELIDPLVEHLIRDLGRVPLCWRDACILLLHILIRDESDDVGVLG